MHARTRVCVRAHTRVCTVALNVVLCDDEHDNINATIDNNNVIIDDNNVIIDDIHMTNPVMIGSSHVVLILHSRKILRDPIFEDCEVSCLTSKILSSNFFQVKN